MKTNRIYYVLLGIAIIGTAGCAGGGSEFNLQVEPASYQEIRKLDLDVILVLDNDFKHAKWIDETGISGWEAPLVFLGENFVINAKQLANTLFSNVAIVESIDQALSVRGDSILKPSVISIMKNRPMWTTDDSTMTVALEWSLTDKDQMPIWLTTIIGEGSAGITDDEKRVKLLIDDLFSKTYQEIISSPEIQYFISTK